MMGEMREWVEWNEDGSKENKKEMNGRERGRGREEKREKERDEGRAAEEKEEKGPKETLGQAPHTHGRPGQTMDQRQREKKLLTRKTKKKPRRASERAGHAWALGRCMGGQR